MRLEDGLSIRGATLRNRIIMPPLVCFNWGDGRGYQTRDRAAHYGRRAAGGVGLIVAEATAVCPEGRIHATELGLWEDGQIDQFARIADACAAHGVPVIVQLVHAGAKAAAERRVSASPSEPGAEPKVEAMDEAAIAKLVDDYAAAARRARVAGLAGVEIHGAHGYLINQFSSAASNRREDGYGSGHPDGAAAGRRRLALEVCRAVRSELGAGLVMAYRFGVNDPTLAEDEALAAALEAVGVDLLDVSAGIGWEGLEPEAGFPYSKVTWLGAAMKRRSALPVAAVFGVTKPEQARGLIEGGYCDLVAVGRGLLADPDWAGKALRGEPVNECLHCKPGCRFREDGSLCPRSGKDAAPAVGAA